MTEKISLKILGCGNSSAVPVIGCRCSVCSSSVLENRRMRTSALLTYGDLQFLIDAGPDFYHQAIQFDIASIDGFILTHSHYDHIAGIDELRIFYLMHQQPVSCLCAFYTYEELRHRYYYLFESDKKEGNLAARFSFQVLEKERGSTVFAKMPMQYFTYEQAGMKVLGMRIENLAYVSDIKDYPHTLLEDLAGVDVLVISALRHEPSAVHLSIQEAIDFSKQVKAKRTYITHMDHHVDYVSTSKALPDNIYLCYDGLIITP